ncbi:flavohemoglobin expression-modulating QEGLA motif protein [Brevundimonas naejangsanensis]
MMGREASSEAGFIAELAARITAGKSVRRKLPGGGRIHVDRLLPFIVIHHRRRTRSASAALGVASASPVYAIWPMQAEGDAFAYDLIESLSRVLKTPLGAFLVVELYDLPVPETDKADSADPTPYRFQVDASDHRDAQHAATALKAALGQLELERQTPRIDPRSVGQDLVALPADTPRLSLGIPRTYRTPGGEGVFPGVLHDLQTGVLDALLHALCGVVAASSLPTPVHYRALGRRGFIRAARHVDHQLAEVAGRFDFLLSVSPINTAQAWEAFRDGGKDQEPIFHYRPLTVDASREKRALYAIDVDGVEDPVLETLFREKQQEIDLQLTLLQSRQTTRFRDASVMLYGRVDDRLADQAAAVLAALQAKDPNPTDEEDAPNIADCHAVRDAATALVARYRKRLDDFKADISLRDDVAGLMVSGPRLMISRHTRMRATRVDPLLQHEVSVHLLTYFTGKQQGLQIFRSGLAGYEGIQEGLGVFAEFAVGGLTRERMRLLAARVIAVHAMIDGAAFLEAWRLLTTTHGVPSRTAFHICARVYRSGGFAKDFIYLRGLLDVLDWLGAGRSLNPFWSGKVAMAHVPVIDELNERGFLRPPAVIPEFLDREDARANLDRAAGGLTLADLL